MILFQWAIIISCQTSLFLLWIYGIHLHYLEKIEQAYKDIEEDYKDEVSDKRLYRKHLNKLKKELEWTNELLWYMKEQAKENRLYKKYFNINNK